jgi:hypothetical protein
MDRKILFAVAVTAALVAAGFYIFPPEPWQGYEITADEAQKIVQDLYPNVTGKPVFEEQCELCDERGNCTKTAEACWKVNVSVNGTGAGVAVNPATGGIVGKEQDCIWWRCTPIPCSYMIEEGGTIQYNSGCDNSVPTCDADLSVCRPCAEKPDCLRKKEYSYMREYILVGTPVFGYYNTLTRKCIVMEKYTGFVSEEECEGTILAYVSCTGGECMEA